MSSCSTHPAQVPTGFCHCVVDTVLGFVVDSPQPSHSRAGPGSPASLQPCPCYRMLCQNSPATSLHCPSSSAISSLTSSQYQPALKMPSFCTGSLWQNPIPLPPGTDSACSLSTQLTVALGKASLTPAWDDSPPDLPLSSLFLKSNNKGDRKEEQHEHRGQNGCWSKDAGAHGWNREYILENGTHKALRHPQRAINPKTYKDIREGFYTAGQSDQICIL